MVCICHWGIDYFYSSCMGYLFESTGSWLHKFNHNYVVYSKHLKSCQYFVGDSNNTFFTLSGGCKQQQHKAHGKLNSMKAWVILILDYFVNPFNQSATHIFTLTASQTPTKPFNHLIYPDLGLYKDELTRAGLAPDTSGVMCLSSPN